MIRSAFARLSACLAAKSPTEKAGEAADFNLETAGWVAGRGARVVGFLEATLEVEVGLEVEVDVEVVVGLAVAVGAIRLELLREAEEGGFNPDAPERRGGGGEGTWVQSRNTESHFYGE